MMIAAAAAASLCYGDKFLFIIPGRCDTPLADTDLDLLTLARSLARLMTRYISPSKFILPVALLSGFFRFLWNFFNFDILEAQNAYLYDFLSKKMPILGIKNTRNLAKLW